jgi:hypothetical protein
MLRNNRVLFYNGGSFEDLSIALSDIHAQTKVIDFTAPNDYIYIGSDFPFNHRYFDLSVVNAVAATLSIDIWDGNSWVPVVDIMDETAVAGVPLAQSGTISWQVDLDESSWNYDDTNEMDNSGLTTGPKIFKLYWIRMKYSATLTATTALRYVGHRFSEDAALESEYPELAGSAIKTAWKAGKTDWKEQTLLAGEYIVQDLRGVKDLITSASQILDWRQFEKASIHKTAEIIFRGMGDDYLDQRKDANIEYKKALAVGKFNVDLNLNANLEEVEKTTSRTYATR